jgi:hypothetical protein
MARLIEASSPLLKIIVFGAYLVGVLLSATGILLIYFGATGNTEFTFFGQSFKSTNIGISALFIGAATIVLLVRRAMKSLDIAIRGESNGSSKNGNTLEAQVKIVDVLVEAELIKPTIDIKVRNVGDKVAVIKQAEIQVNTIYPFGLPSHLRFNRMPSSHTYEGLELPREGTPYLKIFEISQVIPANDADRFSIQIINTAESDNGLPAIYDITLCLIYNENDDKTPGTQLFVGLPSNNSIVGFYDYKKNSMAVDPETVIMTSAHHSRNILKKIKKEKGYKSPFVTALIKS